jgi:DNA polymerase-3 subunit gamma/tau
MSLVSQRPCNWSEIVGQNRAIEIIKAAISHPEFLNRGFILKGPTGVGKTITAIVMARALMCTGGDPLGCGTCDSCNLRTHNLLEVDGAQYGGHSRVKELIDFAAVAPIDSKRRVVIVNAAHLLTKDAWSVFQRPLEAPANASVFIFVSSQGDEIEHSIRSRCCVVEFHPVAADKMLGTLSNLASNNNITYKLEALQYIAHAAKGIVRDAVQWLDTAATLGEVTVENVRGVVDNSLEDLCKKFLLSVASRDMTLSVKLADEIGIKTTPGKAIEMMLSVYGRSVFGGEELRNIYLGLPAVGDVTNILIKWSHAPHGLPSDALPLLAFELLTTKKGAIPKPAPAPVPEAKAASVLDD